MDAESMPTGEILAVEGTPYDFTGEFSAIGDRDRLTGAIMGGDKPGIDHAFVIDREGGVNTQNMVEACTLRHDGSGREMKIWTT